MKDRGEMLRDIEDAKSLTIGYLKTYPGNSSLEWVSQELDRLSRLVQTSWPLSQVDRDTIYLGVYAARNLDELDNAKLAVKLSHIDADLKR